MHTSTKLLLCLISHTYFGPLLPVTQPMAWSLLDYIPVIQLGFVLEWTSDLLLVLSGFPLMRLWTLLPREEEDMLSFPSGFWGLEENWHKCMCSWKANGCLRVWSWPLLGSVPVTCTLYIVFFNHNQTFPQLSKTWMQSCRSFRNHFPI